MDEKKLSIIKKGLELFSLYGIRSVTMDDLAREISVSKKTLYQFFNNKSELVKEVMEFTAQEILDQLESEPGDETNAIEEFFYHRRELFKKLSRQNTTVTFDLKKYYPDVFNKVKEIRRKVLSEVYIRNLKKGISQEVYRPDLDINFLASLMTGSHVFTFDPVYGIFEEEELLSDRFRNNLLNYHFRGICSEKGLGIFEKLMEQSELLTR
jgi:AcrR family transcriptional regulator